MREARLIRGTRSPDGSVGDPRNGLHRLDCAPLPGSIDDAGLFQSVNLGLSISQNIPEDLLGMLPQNRRRRVHLARGFGKADRGVGNPHLTRSRLIDLHQHVPVPDVGVVADLLEVIDGRVGNTGLLEDPFPLGCRLLLHHRLQDSVELPAVFCPERVGS